MKGEPFLKEDPDIESRERRAPGDRLCLRTVMLAMFGWLKNSVSGDSSSGLGLCVAEDVLNGGVKLLGTVSDLLILMGVLFSTTVDGGVLSDVGTSIFGLRIGILTSLAFPENVAFCVLTASATPTSASGEEGLLRST